MAVTDQTVHTRLQPRHGGLQITEGLINKGAELDFVLWNLVWHLGFAVTEGYATRLGLAHRGRAPRREREIPRPDRVGAGNDTGKHFLAAC